MAQSQTRSNDSSARDLVVQPARLPMPAEAAPYGCDPGRWKALVDSVFPSAKTVNGVMLALQYCKDRKLDIMKKPVHIVPMWNSALGREVETVWPGINEYRTTASRTGQWAGNDECKFGPIRTEGFKEKATRGRGQNSYVAEAECAPFAFPEWARVTVYKIMGGQRVPFVGPKVYFKEIFSGEKGLRVPNEKWRTSPRQMLEKCAEAAALRRAFPEELGNDYTAEEMAGKEYAGDPIQARRDEFTDQSVAPEAKPVRHEDKPEWEQKGIPKECWDEIERLQPSIDDPGSTPAGLRKGKEAFVDKFAQDWPDAALDELELRFDTAIGKFEEDDGGSNQQGSEEDDEQTTN